MFVNSTPVVAAIIGAAVGAVLSQNIRIIYKMYFNKRKRVKRELEWYNEIIQILWQVQSICYSIDREVSDTSANRLNELGNKLNKKSLDAPKLSNISTNEVEGALQGINHLAFACRRIESGELTEEPEESKHDYRLNELNEIESVCKRLGDIIANIAKYSMEIDVNKITGLDDLSNYGHHTDIRQRLDEDSDVDIDTKQIMPDIGEKKREEVRNEIESKDG